MRRGVPAPRILLAGERFSAGRGGIGRVARLMARSVQDAVRAGNLMVEAVSLSDEAAASEFGFPVYAASGSRLRFLAAVLRRLLHADYALYDFAGTARAHLAVFRARVPNLTMIHGVEVWEKAMPHHLRACRRARHLLANSAFTRAKAERIHGSFARARVCWLATEEDVPAAPQPNRKPHILMLGRMQRTRDKGHSALIAAMPQVLAKVPEARLVIAGTGDALEMLKNQAAASSTAAAIQFRGFVPEADIDGLWAECSVFAMPSYGEGFGLVYVEAMRNGLPILASTLDAAPEINLHGETGFNADPRDSAELGRYLVELLRNPVRAGKMGQAGQQRWSQHFRYAAFHRRFFGLLTECLDRGPQ
jgi:phosphatidyl-myo-inositol dimannoside synthase